MPPETQTLGTLPVSPSVGLWNFYKKFQKIFLPSTTTILSPFLDIVMAGGASLVLFAILSVLLTDDTTHFNTWALAIYYAAFIVNFPHFISSYLLLYRDSRKDFVFSSNNRWLSIKFWWVGLVVPCLLIGYFIYALMAENSIAMGYLAGLLFLTVGWHYTKQTYGCFVVLSSAKKVYYSFIERWAVLGTLYALWAVSFIASNTYGGTNVFYQIQYPVGTFSKIYLWCALTVLALGICATLCVLLYKYLKEHKRPPLSAIIACIAIFPWFFPFYIWFPKFPNQYFFYIIPLSHSLQYLLFVVAYKRNWSLRDDEHELPAVTSRDTTEMPERTRITNWGAILFILVPTMLIALVMKLEHVASIETLLNSWFPSPLTITSSHYMIAGAVAMITSVIIVAVWRWSKRSPLGKFLFFFLLAFIFGTLLFALIPDTMDILARNHKLPSSLSYSTAIFGTSLYLFFFTILINVHHFFIDNIIWRRDNPNIRKFLFTR